MLSRRRFDSSVDPSASWYTYSRWTSFVPAADVCLLEDYSTLCVVRADLSPLNGTAEPKSGRNGKTYWTIVFSVEIHFGLTEFRARIKWNDNVCAVSTS